MKILLFGAIILLICADFSSAKLIAGFVRAEAGSVVVNRIAGAVTVKAPNSTRLMMGDVIQTDDAFKGDVLPFDGSRYELPARTTHQMTEDGIFGQRAQGWQLMHGFLIPLTGSNLNGLVPRGAQPGAQFEASGVAVVHRSTGPMAPTTKGVLHNNYLLRTGKGTIAKVDGAGRGIAILRANTDMRVVPGGYSLEQGGALLHLGVSTDAAIWTGRVRVKGLDVFVEIASIGGRDTVRVLRGRAEFKSRMPNVRRKRFVARGGQVVIIEKNGEAKVSRFKDAREARKVARDFVSRMNKTGLTGFPGWTGQTSAPPPEPLPGPVVLPGPVAQPGPVAPAPSPKQVRAKALQPGPPIGRDREGRNHLDPMKRTVPGSSPKDWTTVN